MRRLWRDYSLSVILVSAFGVSIVLQAIFSYLASETRFEFLAEVFANWQSEFLQLATFVYLTVHLRHKGSPQSKGDSDGSA